MRSFKELLIWQKAVDLVVLVYKVTKKFPDEEKYGLTVQMRRCAVSIPSNIAEGHMRTTNKVFKQFIGVARGSCSELETQSLIAFKLGFLSQNEFQSLEEKTTELAKMLSSFNAQL
jgi:four helix bundle protein